MANPIAANSREGIIRQFPGKVKECVPLGEAIAVREHRPRVRAVEVTIAAHASPPDKPRGREVIVNRTRFDEKKSQTS
jgi:hypothetical protein